MFDELEKYQNQGHFFFEKGSVLSEVSKDVPNEAGVYIVYKLAKGKITLVYIGKSGTMNQNGTFKDQKLRKRLNTCIERSRNDKHEGVKRQVYFENKIEEENIDALDIYCYVTFDKTQQDLPAYVEGLLLQRYFEVYGELPTWNKAC